MPDNDQQHRIIIRTGAEIPAVVIGDAISQHLFNRDLRPNDGTLPFDAIHVDVEIGFRRQGRNCHVFDFGVIGAVEGMEVEKIPLTAYLADHDAIKQKWTFKPYKISPNDWTKCCTNLKWGADENVYMEDDDEGWDMVM